MKTLLAVILLGLSSLTMAQNMVDLNQVKDSHGNSYFINKQGILQPYSPVSRNIFVEDNRKRNQLSEFQDWQYIDENGYDYTVKIKVK